VVARLRYHASKARIDFDYALRRARPPKLSEDGWSQVRVTIPAVDPYERSLLASEALRDTWKRV
jgi:hypothetical protein